MGRGDSSGQGLGLPGQVEGRATLQSDRGDETQALFRYQWTAGVVLLVAAVGCLNKYRAVWCEHHDDLLGELDNGAYHAIQVKTDATSGATWRCSSQPFVDSVRKFVGHEATYGPKIEQYILYANIGPYVPAATARKVSTVASSPMRLCDECRNASSHDKLVKPYCDAFSALCTGTGADPDVLFRVLRKLEFQKGVPLEGYKEHLSTVIGSLSHCRQLTLGALAKLRDELLFMVGEASSLAVSPLDFYASVLEADGRPTALVRGKRISVEEIETMLNQHPTDSLRYAGAGGFLQVGSVKGQKDVLRRKMTAGYVGTYFPAMWLQAMAAEERLLGEALLDPKEALRKREQLLALMLVECQTAEAAAAAEPDERKRGAKMLQRIIERAEDRAKHDKSSAEHERAETLLGVAGLLSGSCHFAWGVPLEEDGNGT